MGNPTETTRLLRRTRWVALALVGLVALAGCQRAAGQKIVDTEEVESTSASRKVSADATLEAVETVPIAPEISGKISEVFVADGDEVAAGDTLFTIDTAALSDQLAAVEASGDGGGGGGGGGSAPEFESPDLEPTFEQLNEAVTAQKDLIDRQIEAIQADPSRSPIDKTIEVLDKEAEKIQLDVDNARFQTEVSTGLQGDLANAEASAAFGSALGGLGGGGGNPQADAQAAELRRQIDAGTVTAPINGVVSFAQLAGGGVGGASPFAQVSTPGEVRAGVLVTAGQTVMTIFDTADVRVEADVEEADVALVEPGQTAEVFVDAFDDESFDGHVLSVAVNPTVSETGETTYETLIRIPTEGLGNWRPGMRATTEISIESDTKGVELPASAIVSEEGTDYVFVVDDGSARKVEVAQESARSGFVLVTDGLKVGDVVVTAGAQDLEDGEEVQTEP